MRLVPCIVFVVLLFALANSGRVLATTSDLNKPVAESTKKARPIPFRENPVIPPSTGNRIIFAILLAIGVAVLVIYFLKRYFYTGAMSNSTTSNIKLLEMKKLSPKLNLYLVEVKSKQILIAQSGDMTSQIIVDDIHKDYKSDNNECIR